MAAELHGLSDEELAHRMLDRSRDLVSARFRHSLGQLENTSELRVIRREIARIKTEARSREIAQGLPKDSLIRSHRGSHQADAAGVEEAPAESGGFLKGIVDKLTSQE